MLAIRFGMDTIKWAVIAPDMQEVSIDDLTLPFDLTHYELLGKKDKTWKEYNYK